MVDIAIIGAGPAGLSAAINGIQRNKTVKVFGRNIETSLLYKAENVDNYLGLTNVSGKTMMETFFNHANEKGVDFQEGRVLQILSMGDYYSINVDNEFFEAKTIIIATGINRNKTIDREEEFIGKGVSYCATCDGMFYRGKTVVVVAESFEGESDVKFLSEICKKVYFLPRYNGWNRIEYGNNVEVIEGIPKKVIGEDKVSALQVGNVNIECDGIFFIKIITPLKDIIYGLQIENNGIAVNRFMETNLNHVYAAGDCTGRPFQVSKAVGEGLIAAQQAIADLDEMKK